MIGAKRRKILDGTTHSPTPRRSAPTTAHLFGMIEEAAQELSRRLESGQVPRARRPEARRLVMETWLAVGRPAGRKNRGQAGRDVASLREILRAVDRFLADSEARPEPVLPVSHRSPGPPLIDLGACDQGLTMVGGAIRRILALERAVAVIVRRTEIMVEHALKTLKRGRTGSGRPTGPAPREGREDLELVWGETEG